MSVVGDRLRAALGPAADAVRGAAIGTAEAVPGVSGGTVALIVGVYERLVSSLGTLADGVPALLRCDARTARRCAAAVDWRLIVPLAAGVAVAIAVAVQVVPLVLERHREETMGLFFGLVLASIAVPWRMIERRRPVHALLALPAAALSFVVAGTATDPVSDPALAFVAAGASIAVVALVLPGVSGSFLLLVMGLYEPTLAAVADLDLAYTAVFAAGATVGLGVFARVMRRLLRERRDVTLAVLVGLIAGALRGVWPYGEEGTLHAPPADASSLVVLALAVAGAGLVAALVVTTDTG